MDIQFSNLRDSDWSRIREIYMEGIATGNATFETEAPRWAAWDATHRRDCRLIALSDGHIIGWSAFGTGFSKAGLRGCSQGVDLCCRVGSRARRWPKIAGHAYRGI